MTEAADPAPGAYVVLYRRGPGWRAEAPLGEQRSVREHIANLVAHWRRGSVEHAGPFALPGDRIPGELVGLAVLTDRAAADELARSDPAVLAGVLEAEVLPWHR